MTEVDDPGEKVFLEQLAREEVRRRGTLATARMRAVFDAVGVERDYGDRKHGTIGAGGGHTLGEWVILAEAELAEAKLALIKGGKGRNSLRSELLQVAAVCVAALEQHGLEEPHEGRQI